MQCARELKSNIMVLQNLNASVHHTPLARPVPSSESNFRPIRENRKMKLTKSVF
jgi:hypothetical protein